MTSRATRRSTGRVDRRQVTRRRAAAALACLGTAAAVLVVTPVDDAGATVAGRDGLIAYVGVQNNDYDVYVADPVDGSTQNLTQTPGNGEQDPAWSPAGDRLAFARAQAHYDVWVMNADGTEPVNLTPGPNDGQGNSGRRPAWSPDGTQIAYEDAGEIWVMNADGSEKENLTGTPATEGIEGDPVFSPDGEQIAYVRELDVWVMDVDGTNQQHLVGSDEADRSPDW